MLSKHIPFVWTPVAVSTACILLAAAVLAISRIGAYSVSIWTFEAAPAIIAVLVFAATRKRFAFTPQAYVFMLVAVGFVAIGAHYSYNQMPLFDRLRDAFHLSRNHYDRAGHFVQGFVPALITRELLVRKAKLKDNGITCLLTLAVCMAISALWEILEWAGICLSGRGADPDKFLGMQGDVWDSQWDMFCAMCGAIVYCATTARAHSRWMAEARSIPVVERRATIIYGVWAQFLGWFGTIYCAFAPPQIKAQHIRELLRHVRPGDILCRDYRFYAVNHFIPGKYAHSAVIIDPETAVHAVKEGVCEIDIVDFVKDSDGFVLLRPAYTDGEARAVIATAREILRQRFAYNFSYQERRAAFYCHEFTNKCLESAGLHVRPETRRLFGLMGKKLVTADQLIATCATVLEIYHPQSNSAAVADEGAAKQEKMT